MQKVASKATRRLILEEGYRVDGRGVTDVRAIWSRAGCLPRAHGSALFTRGETQALAVTTLGMVACSSSGNTSVSILGFCTSHSVMANQLSTGKPNRLTGGSNPLSGEQ